MYVGVDGCVGGWVAVVYDDAGFVEARRFDDVATLWSAYDPEDGTVLIDVPIGLHADTADPRPCDDAARTALAHPRSTSVFAVPVRAAVHADTYASAKATQEARTDGSLGVQSWNIADKIAQLDAFLREGRPDAIGTIREAHPEVCFWALAGESTTRYSKTGQPAAAFWERVDVLEAVDAAIVDHVRRAATSLEANVGNDDLADAFALALTASPLTGSLRTLPADPPTDAAGLPMEMVYARPG